MRNAISILQLVQGQQADTAKMTAEQAAAKRVAEKNQSMVDTLKTATNEEEGLELIKKNPKWAIDPDTAPAFKRIVDTQSSMALIKQRVTQAQAATIEEKTKLDALTFGTRQKAIATKTLLDMSSKLGDDLEAQADVAAALEQSMQPDATPSMLLTEVARIRGKYGTKLNVSDVQPQPFKVTLESGATMEGTYNPKTGHFTEAKPAPDLESKFEERERHRLVSKVTDLRMKLDGEQSKLSIANSSKDKRAIQAEIDALHKQIETAQLEVARLSGPKESTGQPAQPASKVLKYNPETGKIE